MTAADRMLYRLGLRLAQKFDSQNIPFSGVRGVAANWQMTGPATFLRNDPRLNDPRYLGVVERQLAVLMHTEEEVRERMAKWASAMREVAEFRAQGGCQTAAALHGCRVGMGLVTDEICLERDPLGLETNAYTQEDDERRIDEAVSACGRNPSVDSFLESMRSLKYRYEPFEWVYEGLDPIMMRTALHGRTGPDRKKSTPAALAAALSTIGERVGLMLLPMPAFAVLHGEQGNGQEHMDVSLLEGLSEDAAMRMRSKTQAVAPEPSTWLLRVVEDGDSDGQGNGHNPVRWIDCKQGVVVDDISARFPELATYSLSRWRTESVLKTWQGLVDLAIQAHTRRGESDSVANWLYVKLSLDVFAVEWERALAVPEIR
jgi:hypothetical protein